MRHLEDVLTWLGRLYHRLDLIYCQVKLVLVSHDHRCFLRALPRITLPFTLRYGALRRLGPICSARPALPLRLLLLLWNLFNDWRMVRERW